MSLCDDPYSIPEISIDEYIGTSLKTINGNFLDLKTELCRLSGELDEVTPDLLNLQTGLCALSTNYSFAKAWVYFKGHGSGFLSFDTTTTYNVFQVSANNTGTYNIIFSNPFANGNYALVGTCSQSQVGGFYTWVQTTTGFTAASATINVRNTTGALTTAEYISLVAYGV